MTWLLGFIFTSPWGKASATAAGVLGLVVAFAWDQRSIGADRAIAKQQRQEARANEIADIAARQSGTGGVLDVAGRRKGRRDPTTRDD